jgi:hypothetical protein
MKRVTFLLLLMGLLASLLPVLGASNLPHFSKRIRICKASYLSSEKFKAEESDN